MEPAFVEPFALADREQAQLVGVVGDEQDPRRQRLAVHAPPAAAPPPQAEPERPQPGEELSPAAVVLAAVDERRVDAERDVVQEAPLARTTDVDAPFLAVE